MHNEGVTGALVFSIVSLTVQALSQRAVSLSIPDAQNASSCCVSQDMVAFL